MIEPLRTWHRLTFVLLALVLTIILALAVSTRMAADSAVQQPVMEEVD